jgi:hypothetical protein
MKLGIICIGKKIPFKNSMDIVRVIMVMLAVCSSSALDVRTIPRPTKLKTRALHGVTVSKSDRIP